MTRLKKTITTFEPAADDTQSVSTAPSVALAKPDDVHNRAPSPARQLQASLADSLLTKLAGAPTQDAYPEPEITKLPLKWTLLGATVVCGAIWTGIALLLV